MFMDLLKQELGDSKNAAHQTRFCCPFCGETKYRFYVHTDKGLWICFRCEERGNPVTFVMEYFNTSFEDAVDILEGFDYDVEKGYENKSRLDQYGSDLSEEEQLFLYIANEGRVPDAEQIKRLATPRPPTNCRSLIANFNNPEAFPFFTYLNRRGVTLEQIKQHNISFVTNGDVELVDGRTMTLINHVVFYTFDDNRKPLYWNTRSIEPNPFIKSFNAPSREGENSKMNTIFNLNNAKHTDCIVVLEGVFNALTIGPSGVATFGKMITDEQIDLLLKETSTHRQPIYLFLDTDAWERMVKAAHRIKNKEPGREVYYVYTGTEDDPNDLGTARSWELINNAYRADSEGDLKMYLDNLGL